MRRSLTALLLAAVLLVMSAVPALASAPKVKQTEYEGNGVVEVDFSSKRVRYKNARVVVKDAAGNRMSVTILEKDGDGMTFRVKKVKPATRYTYTVSGVRKGVSGSYGSVKGSFRTPADVPEIAKVEYDPRDGELEVEFATRVQFRNLKVVVKDADGSRLTVTRTEKGKDDVEVKVKGMTPGQRYTVTVSGVRVKGKGGYITVGKTFTA